MNYAQIRQLDIANGEGVGCTLFVSGCNFYCPHCFNKEYQDFNYGAEWNYEIEDKFIRMCKNPLVDHVSILGGEPFQQDEDELLRLVIRIHEEAKKPIWVWTGYKFNEFPKCHINALHYIDVLIDGQFIEAEKDLMLKWRGSKNQRVIDVKETLKQGNIVLYA